ncbi:RNA methyltransferase [Sphaerotilus sp.]|jgi:tRNA/rRNA methyltransferase|uniref:RNA methyltransferase n=1 Tax=Sphaerotilus sp. TaxID=2093942 RepID=UPI0025D24E12|nr:RNA methyltransferase [Sphaerotilus sp.]
MPDSTPLAPVSTPDSTRFVLVRTSHPGNVGATARAMKVMGFTDLVLVAPRFGNVLSQEETVAMASGAADILVRARIVPTLEEALDGIQVACATAMTPRDFGPPTVAPRPYFAELAASASRVAFVFGSERYGLSNEDVYRCHVCLSIPTHPDYGSLNLAQAVQLLSYDWRQALGGFTVAPRTRDAQLASVDMVQGALAHWEDALVRLGFLNPAVPRKLLPRLNQLCNRAQLTQEEIHVLRGIARAVIQSAEKGPT